MFMRFEHPDNRMPVERYNHFRYRQVFMVCYFNWYARMGSTEPERTISENRNIRSFGQQIA